MGMRRARNPLSRGKVFISYRRDDAAGFAHAIYDRLLEHLPAGRVFKDVASIGAGDDFARRIESALDGSAVVLVLIGRRWTGHLGTCVSRLDDSRDWVRVEVAGALARGMAVIPVLLDGATMPAEAELPRDLRPLARLNAVEVRTTRLEADLRNLQAATMRALGMHWPPAEPGSTIYGALSVLYAFFGGAVLLLVGLASFFTSIPTATLAAVTLFLLNGMLLLRAPIHPAIRALRRDQAMRLGAAGHLIAFTVMAMGASETEGGFLVIFGLMPAAIVFLGSFAMRRVARA
jgi:hypothetical protein